MQDGDAGGGASPEGGRGRRRRGRRRRGGPERGPNGAPEGEARSQGLAPVPAESGDAAAPSASARGRPGEEGAPQGRGRRGRGPSGRQGGGGGGSGGERERDRDRPSAPAPDAARPCSGVLEVDGRGAGILRNPDKDFTPSPDDVRIDAAQIARHDLRPGSLVAGVARSGRNGTWALSELTSVDGLDPEAARAIAPLRTQTPIDPCQHLKLEGDDGDVSLRVIDLMAPLGLGQRALVVAPPRSGKTVLLEKLARRVDTGYPDIELIVLLVNERPEEATHFRRAIKRGKVYCSTADEPDERHVQITEVAGARARRLAELGKDVVLIVDSLTRIARAYNTSTRGGGRTLTGGLDARAMERPKAFFGAARKVEGGGSLTVVATALVETGSRMDEVIFEEFKGTGNMELVLDRSLAERRIWPAIDLKRSGTRREERILDPLSLQAIHVLRKVLAEMRDGDATTLLIQKLGKFPSNRDFFVRLQHDGLE